jgi:hypothetical protein
VAGDTVYFVGVFFSERDCGAFAWGEWSGIKIALRALKNKTNRLSPVMANSARHRTQPISCMTFMPAASAPHRIAAPATDDSFARNNGVRRDEIATVTWCPGCTSLENRYQPGHYFFQDFRRKRIDLLGVTCLQVQYAGLVATYQSGCFNA